MKKITLLLLSLSVLLLLSCRSTSYFLPAVSGNDVSYLPKPMGSDSVKVKNYVGASFARFALPLATGEVTMGFINYNRAHTFKNLNIAYGAFGFAGQTSNDGVYNSSNFIAEFPNKSVIGGGLRTSIGYYENSGNVEFRILSWENALSFESGGYSNFRKRMYALNDPFIISSTKTTFFTTGGASEIIWHSKRTLDNQFAFRLFFGVTPGLRKSLGERAPLIGGGAFDFAFFLKIKKCYGILNLGSNKGFSNKISLGYAF